MPDYHELRIRLVERAKAIAQDLKQRGGKEREEAQRLVRDFERTTKKLGDVGEFPVTVAVGQAVGGAAETAAAQLQDLAKQMADEEEWSKTDAERRLVQLQAARVEVEAFPIRSWTRFFAGLGSTLLVSGSAIYAAAEGRVWPSVIGASSWPLVVPSVVLWIVGLAFLVVALWHWASDDAAKLDRYGEDFGGARVRVSTRILVVPKPVLDRVKSLASSQGSGTSPGKFVTDAITEKIDRWKKEHPMWSVPAKDRK